MAGGPVAAVILAAGASTRMGRPKLLLEWQGRTLLKRVVETALASGLQEITVVTGPETQRMADELTDLPVRLVENPDYAQGMSTSLRAGLAGLSDEIAAALILLADQPLVTVDVIRALIDEYDRTGGPIVQPVYGDQPGNPVLFDRSLFGELQAQQGDQGGREVVRRRREQVRRVQFEDASFQQDVDTPADYEALAGDRAGHA